MIDKGRMREIRSWNVEVLAHACFCKCAVPTACINIMGRVLKKESA